MGEDVYTYMVIDDVYERYTLVVSELTGIVSVHCDECEIWVAEYERELLFEKTNTELLEMIMRAHEPQVNGVHVSFDDTETFL